MRLFGALVLFSTCSVALAGEYAVLTTGARLRGDRHEATEGGKVRLYSGTGYVEIDAGKVQGFEVFADPAPAPAAPAVVLAAPAPVLSPVELADAAADKYGLPRGLVRSVMAAESANRTDAISPKGAIGLMQLMPGTAKDLGVDPLDPTQNVDGGVRLLRDLLLKYDRSLWPALAAYNAGPGAVQKYGGVPPYRETIHYVNRIDRAYRKIAQGQEPAAGVAPSATDAPARTARPRPAGTAETPASNN